MRLEASGSVKVEAIEDMAAFNCARRGHACRVGFGHGGRGVPRRTSAARAKAGRDVGGDARHAHQHAVGDAPGEARGELHVQALEAAAHTTRSPIGEPVGDGLGARFAATASMRVTGMVAAGRGQVAVLPRPCTVKPCAV
jgi:hypothetical protein